MKRMPPLMFIAFRVGRRVKEGPVTFFQSGNPPGVETSCRPHSCFSPLSRVDSASSSSAASAGRYRGPSVTHVLNLDPTTSGLFGDRSHAMRLGASSESNLAGWRTGRFAHRPCGQHDQSGRNKVLAGRVHDHQELCGRIEAQGGGLQGSDRDQKECVPHFFNHPRNRFQCLCQGAGAGGTHHRLPVW